MNKSLYTKNYIADVVKSQTEVPLLLGKDENGKVFIKDLVSTKCILISGHTGSGKTVFLSSFLYTLGSVMHPKDIGIICIEMKMVGEYDAYNKSKLLLRKVIYDTDSSIQALKWCIKEMKTRYKNKSKKPYIVIMIDEYADLILGDPAVEGHLYELAKKGANVGIYLILSTSTPSKRIVTEKLKSVIQSRIAFSLGSRTDSMQLLDQEGAESLKGQGDMLFKENGKSEVLHLQGLFTSIDNVENLQERINHF